MVDQILVQSHFDLVSLPLVLEATELISESATQMALEQSSHFSTATEISVKSQFFLILKPQQKTFEMMLKCC